MTAMKVVPNEPTAEMLMAGMNVANAPIDQLYEHELITIYKAMLSAVEPAPDGLVEQKLTDAGAFAGQLGLRGLAECDKFWERQPYGKRLYYGPEAMDYLHRDVLRTVMKLLDKPALTSRAAVLEEAAKICEVEARAYRKMKTNSDGERTEDADECEELAYCCDLNAKAIRAAKGE